MRKTFVVLIVGMLANACVDQVVVRDQRLHRRLRAGCETPAECRTLLEQARANMADCHNPQECPVASDNVRRAERLLAAAAPHDTATEDRAPVAEAPTKILQCLRSQSDGCLQGCDWRLARKSIDAAGFAKCAGYCVHDYGDCSEQRHLDCEKDRPEMMRVKDRHEAAEAERMQRVQWIKEHCRAGQLSRVIPEHVEVTEGWHVRDVGETREPAGSFWTCPKGAPLGIPELVGGGDMGPAFSVMQDGGSVARWSRTCRWSQLDAGDGGSDQ